MNDNDLILFGKHKGTKLIDVPASYLLWFMDQPWAKDWPDLLAYCQKSKKALEIENSPEAEDYTPADDDMPRFFNK